MVRQVVGLPLFFGLQRLPGQPLPLGLKEPIQRQVRQGWLDPVTGWVVFARHPLKDVAGIGDPAIAPGELDGGGIQAFTALAAQKRPGVHDVAGTALDGAIAAVSDARPRELHQLDLFFELLVHGLAVGRHDVGHAQLELWRVPTGQFVGGTDLNSHQRCR